MPQGETAPLPFRVILGPIRPAPTAPSGTDPSQGQCHPGEVSIMDDPPPQILDGVRVDPPPQPVCVPEDPLEMVLPPGTPPCIYPPTRGVTHKTGAKGPWTCNGRCGGGKSALLSPDLQWVCAEADGGFSPAPPYRFDGQDFGGGGGGQDPDDEDIGGKAAWYWIAGGAALLVGGIAAILYLTGDE